MVALAVAPARETWTETAVPASGLVEQVVHRAGETNVFLSQQSFYGWRRIAQLAQLGACYVDLDYHRTSRWADTPPEAVTDAVLRLLVAEDLPTPSYILSTGRGLLVAWLHSLVPRAALPRWMAVQKHLARSLAQFGADPRALDAARVFRLAGTENSRAGTLVRSTFPSAAPSEVQRWEFDDLADEILPFRRAELADRCPDRRASPARHQRVAPHRILTAASYWETVLADLQRLRRLRWHDGPLPPGQRDTWLFLACIGVSWLTPPAALPRECHGLARELGGWRDTETNSRMSAVFRRAQLAAAGQKVEWNGKAVDPRYRFRAATIIEWLEISPAEMHDADLRVLVDQDRRRLRDRARWHERRAAELRPDRAAYEAQARERRGRAGILRERGLSFRAIGAQLGASEGEIRRLLKSL